MKVPFASRGNLYDDDDKQALMDLLDGPSTFSKWPVIHGFEDKFAEYIGANHAISVTSATAALHLSLKGIGIKPGDEVITTPVTWVATSNVILLEGARPVFVDVEPDTLNLDAAKIEEKITGKTTAILPVHMAGHPVDLDPMIQLADKHGLHLIGDAAHAPGAEYKGKRIGSVEDIGAFSFYTQKNMSTLGEGGMVTVKDPEVFERINLYQNHGVQYLNKVQDPELMAKPWYRDCVLAGFNYRMGEAQAAVGITQLKKLDRFNETRSQLAAAYSELLSGVVGITPPVEKAYARSSWHLYIIQIEDEFGMTRDEAVRGLRELGVEANVHYTPLHYFLPYQEIGYKLGDFPVAEAAYEKIMSLPLNASMDTSQVEYVVESLKTLRANGSGRR